MGEQLTSSLTLSLLLLQTRLVALSFFVFLFGASKQKRQDDKNTTERQQVHSPPLTLL